jgi:hypothetical protein
MGLMNLIKNNHEAICCADEMENNSLHKAVYNNRMADFLSKQGSYENMVI